MSFNTLKQEFEKNGYVTLPFPENLRSDMLAHIYQSLYALATIHEGSVEAIVEKIPDPLWQFKMSRCFRIFPLSLALQALDWAKNQFCAPFDKTEAAVNAVFPQEACDNTQITENHLAIYWRCVRPGKPDAGRPHRDASFWDLEFKEGYNPKISFPFNYLKNCMKIWIPLYGCTPETTLRIIPGSHAMEIPTIIEQTEYGRRPSICPHWLNENKCLFTTPIELSQGSCILFDMNLVHVGPCHNNSNTRISAEFNFISR